jgi:hypothetical protein
MEDAARLISSVESKVLELIGQYRELKELVTACRQENQGLRQKNQEQQQTIIELKEKITLLKLAKTTENKEGTVDAKVRINELVREIDRCIGLLQS